MNLKKIIYIISSFLCFFLVTNVLAASYETIGEASSNLLGVAFGVKMIVRAMFIIAGTAFIMGSIYQYRKYRVNSIEHRLSTVIVLFILGVALMILAFIPMITF